MKTALLLAVALGALACSEPEYTSDGDCSEEGFGACGVTGPHLVGPLRLTIDGWFHAAMPTQDALCSGPCGSVAFDVSAAPAAAQISVASPAGGEPGGSLSLRWGATSGVVDFSTQTFDLGEVAVHDDFGGAAHGELRAVSGTLEHGHVHLRAEVALEGVSSAVSLDGPLLDFCLDETGQDDAFASPACEPFR
jgi:hypothetical protein